MTENERKPVTEAQKNARKRNWNKGQICCMQGIIQRIVNSKTTKKSEQKILLHMKLNLNLILTNWKVSDD